MIKKFWLDLKNKKKIYQPSNFWKSGSFKFYKKFKNKDLKNFKKNILASHMFIPAYNLNNHKNIKIIKKKINYKNLEKKTKFVLANTLNGYTHALSDYRVLKAGEILNKSFDLKNFSETTFGSPLEQFIFEKKKYSRASLNYLLGLIFFKKNTKKFIPKVVLEIGGGYGALGEILGKIGIKNLKYINIDLPVQAYITENYLKKLFGLNKITSYSKTRELIKIFINKLSNFTSLVTWQIENLVGKIDLFVNFISFQEMEFDIVLNYLKYVIKLEPKYILLRNLREGKQIHKISKTNSKKSEKIKGGFGVIKPIKKSDYIKILKDKYQLINSNTLIYGYLTPDNFHSELLLFKKNINF
jgi:putative sugar O-methyltransferase